MIFIKDFEDYSVKDYLELISDVAVGYDGYDTVETLKELIDEMAGYAREAIKLL